MITFGLSMKFENFIARRTIFGEKKNLTNVILNIAYTSVGISVAVMILATTIINGFKYEIGKKMFGFWGHIDVTNSNMTRSFDVLPFEKSSEIYDKLLNIKDPIQYKKNKKVFGKEQEGVFVDCETNGGVDFIRSYLIVKGIFKSKSNFEGGFLKGADKDFHWSQMREYMVAGDTISYQLDKASDEAVISTILAKRLGLKLGSRFIVHFIENHEQLKKRFHVVGIYNTGLEEYDRRFIIVDIRKLQDVLGWNSNEVAGIEVFLHDINDMDIIQDYIYYDILPEDKYAETIKTKFASIFEWLNLQDTNESLILGLMLLVALVNMVTTLLILIMEQTHLIGVLKALGSSNWKLRKIFLYQAAYIMGKGLFIANILGIGLALIQKYYRVIKLDEANYFLSYAPIRFNVFDIVMINFGAIVVILICLIIPSYMITRMSPVRSLRID